MKTRRNIILLVALLCLEGAGCAGKQAKPDTEHKGKAEQIQKQDFPERFSKTVNGVVFDVDLQVAENVDLGNLHQMTATVQQPDVEKAKEVFAKGKAVVKEQNDTGSGEDGMEYPCYSASYNDKAFLNISTNLTYSTPLFEKVSGAFRLFSNYNAQCYSKDRIQKLGDPKKIFENVLKNIRDVGYQLEDAACDYYALDHETMAKEFRMLDKTGETLSTEGISWGAEDDCYYYTMIQQQEGLPVYFGSQDFPEDEESNRAIHVLYSANGIERLEVLRLYAFSKPKDAVNLLDFDTIVQTVAKKYGDIMGPSYTVKRAQLYKMPVKSADSTYDVKIAWLFEVQESGTDSDTGEAYEYTQYMFVDAADGTEVLL